ncbi:MAG: hypothetical protein AAF494_01285 [Pseudomonadota bacterium]
MEAEAAYNADYPSVADVMRLPKGDNLLYVQFGEVPTDGPSTIVADAIGNLRSALDIATVQACVSRGQTDQKLLKHTYFAVGGSENDWWANAPRRMAGADKVVQECVASFKPWQTSGNTLLYSLTKIAASDKHVDLVSISGRGARIEDLPITFSNSDGSDKFIRIVDGIWHLGARNKHVIFGIKSPGQIKIDGPIAIRANFGFANVYGLRNTPAVPTLDEMLVMCEQIVKTLEVAANS